MKFLLTGSYMSGRHVTGRCCLLAAGNTPINCSNGLNWNKNRWCSYKMKEENILFIL